MYSRIIGPTDWPYGEDAITHSLDPKGRLLPQGRKKMLKASNSNLFHSSSFFFGRSLCDLPPLTDTFCCFISQFSGCALHVSIHSGLPLHRSTRRGACYQRDTRRCYQAYAHQIYKHDTARSLPMPYPTLRPHTEGRFKSTPFIIFLLRQIIV